ncbi:hypothetical protein [Gallaecimonas sp. GXIMD4217]|uniref:hypothetical protein n=1 Tax=Gallaecimonas sp. GXIMD4217 TaxID=3131927 RepID=UPI00311B2ED7
MTRSLALLLVLAAVIAAGLSLMKPGESPAGEPAPAVPATAPEYRESPATAAQARTGTTDKKPIERLPRFQWDMALLWQLQARPRGALSAGEAYLLAEAASRCSLDFMQGGDFTGAAGFGWERRHFDEAVAFCQAMAGLVSDAEAVTELMAFAAERGDARAQWTLASQYLNRLTDRATTPSNTEVEELGARSLYYSELAIRQGAIAGLMAQLMVRTDPDLGNHYQPEKALALALVLAEVLDKEPDNLVQAYRLEGLDRQGPQVLAEMARLKAAMADVAVYSQF